MDAAAPDVDVLVVGAGITGIYQLHRAREEGFSARLLEAGSGVGGTWFWNRYPGARFDSESWSYGYLFSEELFDEWEWEEHFAGQPEIERYLNHVVDKFDLRRDMQFDARVTSAVWDDGSATWRVTVADGTEHRARFLIAATGVLSIPYLPDIPGRDDFRGVQHHTGAWPAQSVDFVGKRVAVVGTSSSGVQVVPTILDDAASVTVFQRTANWCTPLNNRPITADEQAQLRADFEELRETLNTSLSGFAHPVNAQSGAEVSAEERRALFEQLWNSPGFQKLTSNYYDLLFNDAVNDEWCEFIADKIRGIVARSRHRGEAHPQRPPLRRQAATVRHRLLRVVQRPEGVARRSPRHADRARHRDRHRDHRRARASSTSSCGPPASTSAPAPSAGWASSVATGSRSPSTGPTVPRPSWDCRHAGSPTSSSPAARTRRPATTLATTATSSTS